MVATRSRPLRDTARRGYRDAIREARSLGVPEGDISMVVGRFLGENPDPGVFRDALVAYVPLSTFDEQDREARDLARQFGETLLRDTDGMPNRPPAAFIIEIAT